MMNAAAVQPPSSSTSVSLLERAKARQDDAWTKIAELYGPEEYRWVRCRGLQVNDAKDLVQEVFKSVFVALPNFRRDQPGQTFRGWLRTITRNKLNDHFRRVQAHPVTLGDHEALDRLSDRSGAFPPIFCADEEDADDASADGRLVRRALGFLRVEFTSNVWQAFWGVAIEGRSPGDVAASLGISRNAVYQYKARVLQRLQQEFGDLLDDGKNFSPFL